MLVRFARLSFEAWCRYRRPRPPLFASSLRTYRGRGHWLLADLLSTRRERGGIRADPRYEDSRNCWRLLIRPVGREEKPDSQLWKRVRSFESTPSFHLTSWLISRKLNFQFALVTIVFSFPLLISLPSNDTLSLRYRLSRMIILEKKKKNCRRTGFEMES